MPELTVKNITKYYPYLKPKNFTDTVFKKTEYIKVLDNISFEIPEGTITALTGPNGSGKTTLLKIISDIILPDSGEIIFNGKKSFLFSLFPPLFEKLTVEENIKLLLSLLSSETQNTEFIDFIIKEAEVDKYRDYEVYKLSSGYRLRIMASIFFNMEYDLYLIDEALIVGDINFRKKCYNYIKKLKENNKTVIFSTHQNEIIEKLADYELNLKNGKLNYFKKLSNFTFNKSDIFYSNIKRIELLKELLKTNGYTLIESKEASIEDLETVHTKKWIDKVMNRKITSEEEEKYILPHANEMSEYALKIAGSSIMASYSAIKYGLGISLIGGAHHAFDDHGEGFCIINDCAVSIKKLMNENLIKKPAIIDLDAHQGNGNAYIFKNTAIKTFSIHSADGYPYIRFSSDVDINLKNDHTSKEYLFNLYKNLPYFLDTYRPDFVFLILSSDVYKDDPVGKINLDEFSILKRDIFTLRELSKRDIPTCLTIPAGYGDYRKHAEINMKTVLTAQKYFKSFNKCIFV